MMDIHWNLEIQFQAWHYLSLNLKFQNYGLINFLGYYLIIVVPFLIQITKINFNCLNLLLFIFFPGFNFNYHFPFHNFGSNQHYHPILSNHFNYCFIFFKNQTRYYFGYYSCRLNSRIMLIDIIHLLANHHCRLLYLVNLSDFCYQIMN